MKKYILPLVVGYVSVAALAGLVVVPLYFNPITAALHEAFPVAYYAEPLLWAGFTAGLLQTLLQVIIKKNIKLRFVKTKIEDKGSQIIYS